MVLLLNLFICWIKLWWKAVLAYQYARASHLTLFWGLFHKYETYPDTEG